MPPDDAQEVLQNINDLIQLSNGLGCSETGLMPVHDGEIPKGFLKFERNGTMFSFRKSTILWMLTTNATKVSTDRLHRFIDRGDQEKEKATDEYIRIGDFVRIARNNRDFICSILGFKYKRVNYKFKNSFCPIRHKDDDEDGTKGGPGVYMLVDFHEADGLVLRRTEEVSTYVDIDTFVEHIKTKRDNFTQQYVIL